MTAPTARGPEAARRHATLRRAVRLFGEFRHEQPDPARFYTALAADSVAQLSAYADLCGATLLDVGGGPGYFRDAFTAAGATYVGLDADVGELSGLGEIPPGHSPGQRHAAAVRRRLCRRLLLLQRPGARQRPLADGRGDGPGDPPGRDRVPQLDGLVGTLGGPRDRAVALPRRCPGASSLPAQRGTEPKNRFGESLFPVTVADGLVWASRQRLAGVVAAHPRYNPGWSWWVLRVPVLRELLTWNLVLVLRP